MDNAAFFTDRYELTMLDAAAGSGEADTPCVFEVFSRHLPVGRRYGLVAGTGRLVEYLRTLRFTAEHVDWLATHAGLSATTLEWLKTFRFRGSIWGHPEGSVYFADTPIVTVQGTFAECVLLETLLLSVMNYDSAVASAASRMVNVAGNKPVMELGSRRAHERAAISAARAAYIAGCAGTSNLAAGMTYGVPTIGTSAHAFTMLYDAESAAFSAQLNSQGHDTTLLVDTYDTIAGTRRAVDIAGARLGAVRIDSGDLHEQAATVRALLDAAGAGDTRIIASGDLDEYRIADLEHSVVDIFGAGTSIVTGSGHPTAGFVYKIVTRQADSGGWVEVSKHSRDKRSRPGRKWAYRGYDSGGVARVDVVVSTASPLDPAPPASDVLARCGRDDLAACELLTQPLMAQGTSPDALVGREAVERARSTARRSVSALSESGRGLSAGLPACDVIHLRWGDG